MSSSMKDLLGDAPFPYRGEAPSQAHSPTSVAAAASIQKAIGPLHRDVLCFLEMNPQGATDEEMQRHLNMPANTQRPRRRELQLMNRIVDSGETRRTQSGRAAVIWKIAS